MYCESSAKRKRKYEAELRLELNADGDRPVHFREHNSSNGLGRNFGKMFYVKLGFMKGVRLLTGLSAHHDHDNTRF